MTEGRIERLYLETQPDRITCDGLAVSVRDLHAKAAASLGLCGEAQGARCAPPADPEALIEQGSSLIQADPAKARTLFDRAGRGLEAKYGRALLLETTDSPNNAMSPALTFSRDGRWLAGSIGIQVTIVDTLAKRKALSLRCSMFGTPTVAFGEGFVATLGCEGAREDRPLVAPSLAPVHAYSMPTMLPLSVAPIEGAVSMAAGRTLLAAADRASVTVFDTAKGAVAWSKSIADSAHPDSYPATLSFDRAASELAVRESYGTTTIFDAKTGAVIRAFAARPTANDPAILTPDGRFVIEGGARAPLFVWNVDTGAKQSLGVVSREHMTFSSSGKRVALWGFGGASTDVYDATTWKLSSKRDVPSDVEVLQVLPTSADGFLEVERRGGDPLVVADVDGRAPMTRIPVTRPGNMSAVALAPDARRWAWMTSDEYFEGNPIHFGDAQHVETIRSHTEQGEVHRAALSNDASMIALSRRPELLLLDVASGQIAQRWPIDDPSALAFSPDNRSLAVAQNSREPAVSPSNGPVRWLDVTSGKEIARIDLKDFDARSLAAAMPLGRCNDAGTKKLADIYGGDVDAVPSVTSDCRYALVVRKNLMGLIPLPGLDPVLVFETAAAKDVVFARLATIVTEMQYDGATTAHLANGTTKNASLERGDFVFLDGVQLIGAGARDLVTCRLGPRVLPLEVCEDRFLEPDLIARFFQRTSGAQR